MQYCLNRFLQLFTINYYVVSILFIVEIAL